MPNAGIVLDRFARPMGKRDARDGRDEKGGRERRRVPAGLNIWVPKLTDMAQMVRWDEWMWKELRHGGYLMDYIRREKATSVTRQRAVSRRMQGFKQNAKSDFELKAAVPAREFFRLREVDPDFWADDKNLKSLKRDNPDMAIYV